MEDEIGTTSAYTETSGSSSLSRFMRFAPHAMGVCGKGNGISLALCGSITRTFRLMVVV